MDDPQQHQKQKPDKVHDGPCAQQFAALEKCAKTKDPRKYRVRAVLIRRVRLLLHAVTHNSFFHDDLLRPSYKRVLQKQIC